MADIKISQLTAKGTAIASTDLIEISESNGAGGYVTKSVTGANIIGSKQDTLVSGTNIKTLNSNSILGSGDLSVQPTLISGTNIKTIEGQSILGGGNINITNTDVGLGNVDNTSDLNKPISTATQTALNAKQNTITNSDSITEGVTNLFLTTGERTKLTNTSGVNTGDQTNITGTAANVTGIVAVANGGTGTATPSLVAGTNITITGSFPNQTIAASGAAGAVTQIVAGTNVTVSPAGGTGVVTINASGGGGGGTEIGDQIGGGIVIAVFNDNGVNKALVASLTNLSTALPYTIPAFQGTSVPLGAQSYSDGFTNTNNIISQTLLPASTSYAAGIARLFAGGGFSDWYLPANWELNMCYDAAGIVNRILGSTNGFQTTTYQSSTERNPSGSWFLDFFAGSKSTQAKSSNGYVRAVRIHTI